MAKRKRWWRRAYEWDRDNAIAPNHADPMRPAMIELRWALFDFFFGLAESVRPRQAKCPACNSVDHECSRPDCRDGVVIQ